MGEEKVDVIRRGYAAVSAFLASGAREGIALEAVEAASS